MRLISVVADRLLGRLAPRGRAGAVCIGDSWVECRDGVLHLMSVCRPYDTVIGTC